MDFVQSVVWEEENTSHHLVTVSFVRQREQAMPQINQSHLFRERISFNLLKEMRKPLHSFFFASVPVGRCLYLYVCVVWIVERNNSRERRTVCFHHNNSHHHLRSGVVSTGIAG